MFLSENVRKMKKKKNMRKMQENYTTRENFSILRYELVKNVSQLRFSQVFAQVCTHKPYQNANPTESVILALGKH